MSQPAASAESKHSRTDRLGLLLAVLLGALGLMGALTAWRVGDAGDTSSDASQDALLVARALAAEEVAVEGMVNQTMQSWLDYERSRQRAESLRNVNAPDLALEADKVAAAHYFGVRPEYLDEDGNYDPAQHRASYMAEAASRHDIDPAPHVVVAENEEARIRDLLAAGVLLGLALPVVTYGELTSRRRLRQAAAVVGSAIFVISSVMVVLAWL